MRRRQQPILPDRPDVLRTPPGKKRHASRLACLAAGLLLSGCAAAPSAVPARHDTADTRHTAAGLGDGAAPFGVGTNRVRQYLKVMLDLEQAAGLDADLALIDGSHPNAFASLANGRPVILVNFALLELVRDNDNEFAALIGHELAHFRLGHHEKTETRQNILSIASSVAGIALSAIGIPFASAALDQTADVVDKTFNREQEEDADDLGLEYMIKAGYDPRGALSFHEKLGRSSAGGPIPLLSTHPSGPARVRHLEKLLREHAAPD